jgi:hypothetical protein
MLESDHQRLTSSHSNRRRRRTLSRAKALFMGPDNEA